MAPRTLDQNFFFKSTRVLCVFCFLQVPGRARLEKEAEKKKAFWSHDFVKGERDREMNDNPLAQLHCIASCVCVCVCVCGFVDLVVQCRKKNKKK